MTPIHVLELSLLYLHIDLLNCFLLLNERVCISVSVFFLGVIVALFACTIVHILYENVRKRQHFQKYYFIFCMKSTQYRLRLEGNKNESERKRTQLKNIEK